jgi:hypothetical protein
MEWMSELDLHRQENTGSGITRTKVIVAMFAPFTDLELESSDEAKVLIQVPRPLHRLIHCGPHLIPRLPFALLSALLLVL